MEKQIAAADEALAAWLESRQPLANFWEEVEAEEEAERKLAESEMRPWVA